MQGRIQQNKFVMRWAKAEAQTPPLYPPPHVRSPGPCHLAPRLLGQDTRTALPRSHCGAPLAWGLCTPCRRCPGALGALQTGEALGTPVQDTGQPLQTVWGRAVVRSGRERQAGGLPGWKPTSVCPSSPCGCGRTTTGSQGSRTGSRCLGRSTPSPRPRRPGPSCRAGSR